MKLSVVLLVLLLPPALSLAQTRPIEPTEPVYRQEIVRDLKFEQEVSFRAQRLGRYLEPEALKKLDRITQALLTKTGGSAEVDYYLTTQRMVQASFPKTSQEQADLLTFCALSGLLDELKGRLNGTSEMSEMTSLRLQMTMDRRSKFISTLSQIMKKISSTQDMLVQNLK